MILSEGLVGIASSRGGRATSASITDCTALGAFTLTSAVIATVQHAAAAWSDDACIPPPRLSVPLPRPLLQGHPVLDGVQHVRHRHLPGGLHRGVHASGAGQGQAQVGGRGGALASQAYTLYTRHIIMHVMCKSIRCQHLVPQHLPRIAQQLQHHIQPCELVNSIVSTIDSDTTDTPHSESLVSSSQLPPSPTLPPPPAGTPSCCSAIATTTCCRWPRQPSASASRPASGPRSTTWATQWQGSTATPTMQSSILSRAATTATAEDSHSKVCRGVRAGRMATMGACECLPLGGGSVMIGRSAGCLWC
jgi:hypothetical protein